MTVWPSLAQALGSGTQADLAVISVPRRRDQLLSELSRLRRRWSGVRIILVLDDQSRGSTAARALRDGVWAIVLAEHLERSLTPTVRAVLADQICVPHSLQQHFVRPTLSKREKQSLGLLVLGMSNADIARHLFLTESTVKSHLSSAYRKLGVGSRDEAITRLLDPDAGLGTGILKLSQDGETPVA